MVMGNNVIDSTEAYMYGYIFKKKLEFNYLSM